MPPKKKTKTALTPARDQSSPAATAEGHTPTPTTHQKEQIPAEPIISDGWTDEQETTLFKAVSVYNMKPAGTRTIFTIANYTKRQTDTEKEEEYLGGDSRRANGKQQECINTFE